MNIYDRPSLKLRKLLGRVKLGQIEEVLKRKWQDPIGGLGPWSPMSKVKLRDGRVVWVDGHVCIASHQGSSQPKKEIA